MDCCSPEKRKLIEEVGLHFEKSQQLAPLAARIYAIMILSPNAGQTFDEIIQITDASKSSVSTQLNLLMQLKKVDYFTIPGDRKRYFRSSKAYLKNTLKEYLENISEEIHLIEKIIDFNSAHNKEKFEKDGHIPLMFKDYLNAHKENLEKTIKKVSDYEKK
ncbi:transcriptional regulator [Gramella sp. AN32]|uniref:GbsR/MarR family transcriptional regulator n=1 Tax=Christiangramia antarctica TaxID=2058158 RepID=A0ABW5X2Y7_9FLAO|nr:transcriptional regulator [Gramella sp. AN32]MCM4154905.1 transcriptional regulator [Gramella sp. AN32]